MSKHYTAANVHYSPTWPNLFNSEFFGVSLPVSKGGLLVLRCSETPFDKHVVIRSRALLETFTAS